MLARKPSLGRLVRSGRVDWRVEQATPLFLALGSLDVPVSLPALLLGERQHRERIDAPPFRRRTVDPQSRVNVLRMIAPRWVRFIDPAANLP
ncbi:MAG: hypothetical protein NTZ61_02450, partial [Proteobacteria bacterium]|nr:hypothetical protein [Pseudomonadota bacterium]